MTVATATPQGPEATNLTGPDGPLLAVLTDEQLVAAGSPRKQVFLESTPGSGKTTVVALRFGARRYQLPDAGASSPYDDRGVLAVSFTRSATSELFRRVRRFWGSSALAWPHRIVTLDTLMCELLEYLLVDGLVKWPGGPYGVTGGGHLEGR